MTKSFMILKARYFNGFWHLSCDIRVYLNDRWTIRILSKQSKNKRPTGAEMIWWITCVLNTSPEKHFQCILIENINDLIGRYQCLSWYQTQSKIQLIYYIILTEIPGVLLRKALFNSVNKSMNFKFLFCIHFTKAKPFCESILVSFKRKKHSN